MSSTSNKGFLCMVLHAHLPYVFHPEYDYFLEENWFYEALTETYIPLLEMFYRLLNDRIKFGITISLSPVLIEMLNNPLLKKRYIRHLERLIDLSEKEIYRTRHDKSYNVLSRMYHRKFKKIHNLYCDTYKKDVIGIFKTIGETGNIHIITTAATHAFLPIFSSIPQIVKAQIEIGVKNHAKTFGKKPAGIWIPECGFMPGYDYYLSEQDLKFFYLDTSGILNAKPSPVFKVYSPIKCPSGIIAFGRDDETSKQVWSSIGGYPGDHAYRDFYRDIGYDVDNIYIKDFLKPFGARTFTGIKYYRVTGSEKKEPYNIDKAISKASEHARHFVSQRNKQIDCLFNKFKIKPVVTAAYDTELLGHWWFEGPDWLEFVIRLIDKGNYCFRMITTHEYTSEYGNKINFSCEPSMSSWGEKGFNNVWVNDSNDYACRHLIRTAERMLYLIKKYPNARGIMKRVLNQAARELLLSQHSDWTFLIKTGTAREYAKKRFQEHIYRFNRLYSEIMTDNIDISWLEDIEYKDNIFKEIDYRVFDK